MFCTTGGKSRRLRPSVIPQPQRFESYCLRLGMGLLSASRTPPAWPGGSSMRVLDLVQSRTDVYSIQEETTVHEAARYMRDHKVRSVGVLDAAGKLTGVVSQSDISNKVAAENKCPAWMKVCDIMTRDLISVSLEMTLEDCLALMEKHGIYHLLVVDGRNNFRGMVFVSDLLRVLATDNKERADLLQAFIDPVR